MPSTYDFNATLFRDSLSTPWGFRLEGGRDFQKPLTIQRVFTGSPAAGELQRGDILLAIEHKDTSLMLHQQANEMIKHTGGSLHLAVRRGQAYSGSQTAPRMQTYPKPGPSVQFNSQPPVNRSLYNNPNQGSLFFAEDPLSNYVRSRPIEKVKDPKPILSQTGSPIMPGGTTAFNSRPNVRRYQPSQTIPVVPSLPRTHFEPPSHPTPAPHVTFNVTPTPFNNKKMVSQIQSSLNKAIHSPKHAPAPITPSINFSKPYNQVTYSPSTHKPVHFNFNESQNQHSDWRDSLRKTGVNIYEDQQQPSTQSYQSPSAPSYGHYQPEPQQHHQPKLPRVVNLQYNTPIGLYSKQNINEELHKKIGNQPCDLQLFASSEF
ncbi:unnamed protein product [Brachionus calyciflorus]|uniref:PDZ domain-containing protein n=1 Tax=Brachionus calyciflorus TaxID=104777 RepID=A0A813MNQ4_9BILA|nr:unnamed protein product [Brachionus calyciflorus]